MKHNFLFLLIAICFVACSGNTEKTTSHPHQSELNKIDSLKSLFKQADSSKQESLAKELAYELLHYSKSHPNDSLSAVFVFQCARLYERAFGNYNEAFGLYNSVYRDFPESNLAGEALFMQGLLLETHFGQTDKAKVYLHRFLNEFPNHELVPMANDLLKTAGVPADSLLKQ